VNVVLWTLGLRWQFGVALTANALVLAGLYPILQIRSRIKIALLCLLGFISAASPCAISPEHTAVRLIAALITSGVLVKLYDLGCESASGRVPSIGAYIAFVENSFWHVFRQRPTERSGDTRGNLRLVATNLPAAAVALVAAFEVFHLDWARWPFALEHVVKVLVCYAVIAPATNGFAAVWRLLGQPALATMDHAELARTPADFWRRWNRPTQVFLYKDFFLPAGGWRTPARATLLTFAVSALIHEYVFGIATSHVQGVQTCFFMLQALAVIATLRLRLLGRRAIIGVILTLAFNLITARLFFASVAAAVPFYVSRVNP
jgi:hypothetical protein